MSDDERRVQFFKTRYILLDNTESNFEQVCEMDEVAPNQYGLLSALNKLDLSSYKNVKVVTVREEVVKNYRESQIFYEDVTGYLQFNTKYDALVFKLRNSN